MRHAYLTKADIDKAYLAGGITIDEVIELLETLKMCTRVAQAVSKQKVY